MEDWIFSVTWLIWMVSVKLAESDQGLRLNFLRWLTLWARLHTIVNPWSVEFGLYFLHEHVHDKIYIYGIHNSFPEHSDWEKRERVHVSSNKKSSLTLSDFKILIIVYLDFSYKIFALTIILAHIHKMLSFFVKILPQKLPFNWILMHIF